MIEIKDSECICGSCGARFAFSWEIVDEDYEETSDDQMGERTKYDVEGRECCPACENEIYARLQISEYPVGALEDIELIEIQEDDENGESQCECPAVYFWDL